MSMEAELVQALGRIEAKAETTSRTVEQGGNRMQQALRRTARETQQVGAQLTMVQRNMQRVVAGALTAFGVGSITMAAATAVRTVRRMHEASQREREERGERAGSLLAGTRAPEIFDQVTAIREALRSGAPTASDDQLISILQAMLRQGAGRDPAQAQQIARQSMAAPALGMAPAELAALIAAAGPGGADLAAVALQRSDGDASAAMRALGDMTPARAQHLGRGSAGAFQGMLGRADVSEADMLAQRIQTAENIRSQTDLTRAVDDLSHALRGRVRDLSPSQALQMMMAGQLDMDAMSASQRAAINMAIMTGDEHLDPGMTRMGIRTPGMADPEEAMRIRSMLGLSGSDHISRDELPARVQMVNDSRVIGDDQP